MERLDRFDIAAFAEAKSIFRDRLKDMLKDFFADAELFIGEIKKGEESGNFKMIAANAHPLKSSSAAFGLMSLADLARDIEHAATEATQKGAPLDDKARKEITLLDQALLQARVILEHHL